MRVRLSIQSLSIEGLDLQPSHEPALRAAFIDELTALFASGDSLRETDTPRLTANLREGADSRPERLGRQLGRAVHGSVTRHAQ